MTVVALTARQRDPLAETVDWLLAAQCRDGLIPWFAEGPADPWNHVEAAMAIAVSGEFAATRRALMWLAENQNGDGSWWSKYSADSRADRARVDTNAVAYLACGARLYLLASDDRQFVEELFPCLQRALDYVCDWQSADGAAAVGDRCRPQPSARFPARRQLVGTDELGSWRGTGRGVRARSAALASRGRSPRDADQPTRGPLHRQVRVRHGLVLPVLAGALGRAEAQARLEARRSEFFLPGEGVLCRCDGRW